MEGPKVYHSVLKILDSMGVAHSQETAVVLHEFVDRYLHEILASAKMHSERRQEDNSVTTEDVKTAISALTQFSFQPKTHRETLRQLAETKNKQRLQLNDKKALLLPPEEHCLLAQNWQVSREGMELDL